MANPYYSTDGVTYTELPARAMDGTWLGSFELVYAQPTTTTLSASPSGAFGLPQGKIRSPMMSATGASTWMEIMGGSTSGSATISKTLWIDLYDPYSASLQRVVGTMQRPRWSRIAANISRQRTYYYDFEVDILDCTALEA